MTEELSLEEKMRKIFGPWAGKCEILFGAKFEVGDAVQKNDGYPYPGEVRAVFATKAGKLRYVVEATGRLEAVGRGRPAELYSFRREALLERRTLGIGVPTARSCD